MRIIIICSNMDAHTKSETHMRDIPMPLPVSRDVVVPPHSSELKRLSSEELIGPAREVLIRHAGCDYRLRITRQGKLILTK